MPDRTRVPFVWQRIEQLIGWPLPDEPPGSPPPRPSVTTAHFNLPPTPALPRAPRTLHLWFPTSSRTEGEAQNLDPQTYAIGALRISLGSAEQVLTVGETDPQLSGAVVVVEAPGMAPWRLRRTDTRTMVEYGVGRLDPARPEPQVLIEVIPGAGGVAPNMSC